MSAREVGVETLLGDADVGSPTHSRSAFAESGRRRSGLQTEDSRREARYAIP
jgi:hypothetical protein